MVRIAVLFILFIVLIQVAVQAQAQAQQPPSPPGLPVYRIADERIKEDWENRGIVVINPDGSGSINFNEIERLIEGGFYEETAEGLVFTTKGKIFYYIYKLKNTVRSLCPFC